MDPVLSDHMSELQHHDDKWRNATFYCGSDTLLRHFSQYIPGDLRDYPYTDARSLLLDSLYIECNLLWSGDSSGKFTYRIFQTWSRHSLGGVMYTKHTT